MTSQQQQQSAMSKTPRFVTPVVKCFCGGSLGSRPEIDAVEYSRNGCWPVKHCPLQCCRRDCRTTYAYIFCWKNGHKMNTVSLDDITTIFVSDKVAFDMKYLEYHESLQFRGFLSGGAIAFAGEDVLFQTTHSHLKYLYQTARFLRLAMKEFELLEGGRFLRSIYVDKAVSDEALTAYDDFVHEHCFPPARQASGKESVGDGHEKVLQKIGASEALPKKMSGRPWKSGKVKPFTNGWYMI